MSRPGIAANRVIEQLYNNCKKELNLEGIELRRQSHGKRGKRRGTYRGRISNNADQSLGAKQVGKKFSLANMIPRKPEKYTECTIDWNPEADFYCENDKGFFGRFKRVRNE